MANCFKVICFVLLPILSYSQDIPRLTATSRKLSEAFNVYDTTRVNDTTFLVSGIFQSYTGSSFTVDSVAVGHFFWSQNGQKWYIDSVGIPSGKALRIKVKAGLGANPPNKRIGAIIDYSDEYPVQVVGIDASLQTFIDNDFKYILSLRTDTLTVDSDSAFVLIDSSFVLIDSLFTSERVDTTFTDAGLVDQAIITSLVLKYKETNIIANQTAAAASILYIQTPSGLSLSDADLGKTLTVIAKDSSSAYDIIVSAGDANGLRIRSGRAQTYRLQDGQTAVFKFSKAIGASEYGYEWVLTNQPDGEEVVNQAAHGFSVGDVVYLNGSTYTDFAGVYGDTIVPIGIVLDSLNSSTFLLGRSGKYQSKLGLANGIYYATDEGLSTIPDTLIVPVLQVTDKGTEIIKPVGFTKDVSGTDLFTLVTSSGSNTVTGGESILLHADSTLYSNTINGGSVTNVGTALDSIVNNLGSTQTLSFANPNLSISDGNSVDISLINYITKQSDTAYRIDKYLGIGRDPNLAVGTKLAVDGGMRIYSAGASTPYLTLSSTGATFIGPYTFSTAGGSFVSSGGSLGGSLQINRSGHSYTWTIEHGRNSSSGFHSSGYNLVIGETGTLNADSIDYNFVEFKQRIDALSSYRSSPNVGISAIYGNGVSRNWDTFYWRHVKGDTLNATGVLRRFFKSYGTHDVPGPGTPIDEVTPTGTYKLNQYGSGNKEAGDLSLTESKYIAVFGTGGTMLEKGFGSGSASGTTDASGQLTITHSLGFTPSQVIITNTGTPRHLVLTAKGATTFTVTIYDSANPPVAVISEAYSFDWIAVK